MHPTGKILTYFFLYPWENRKCKEDFLGGLPAQIWEKYSLNKPYEHPEAQGKTEHFRNLAHVDGLVRKKPKV